MSRPSTLACCLPGFFAVQMGLHRSRLTFSLGMCAVKFVNALCNEWWTVEKGKDLKFHDTPPDMDAITKQESDDEDS